MVFLSCYALHNDIDSDKVQTFLCLSHLYNMTIVILLMFGGCAKSPRRFLKQSTEPYYTLFFPVLW